MTTERIERTNRAASPGGETELLPCPFCGAAPECEDANYNLEGGYSMPTIRCVNANCPAKPYVVADVVRDFRVTAVERWNGFLRAFSPPVGQAPEQTKCACRVVDGEQVTWCRAHNGWRYAGEMDRLRQEAETRIRTVHGVNCPKAMHDVNRGGYLHHDEDDGPYDVDGVRYCGRCHVALPAAAQAPDAQEREDRSEQDARDWFAALCEQVMRDELEGDTPEFSRCREILFSAFRQIDRMRSENTGWRECLKRIQPREVEATQLHIENARLRADLKEAEEGEEAKQRKLDGLLAAKDWPHSPGTCACSYDRADHVCLVHSPEVVRLRSELEAARERDVARERTLTDVAARITEAANYNEHAEHEWARELHVIASEIAYPTRAPEQTEEEG